MSDKKTISLNFGRMDKAHVDSVAADTLGDVSEAAPSAPATGTAPFAYIKNSQDEVAYQQKELTTIFNFEKQRVTYVSADASINGTSVPFDKFSSPTAVADAYANLKMLGGNPKPYTP